MITIASVAGTITAKIIRGTMFHVVLYFHISRIAVTTEIDAVTAATTSNLVTRLIIQITYDDYFDVSFQNSQ